MADVPLQETEVTSVSQLFLAVKMIHTSYTQFHSISYTFCLIPATNMSSYEFLNGVQRSARSSAKGILRSAFLNHVRASSFTLPTRNPEAISVH